MFRIGDAVIHPSYGVGTVTEIKKRHTLASGKQYYSIELLGDPGTVVMVPATMTNGVNCSTTSSVAETYSRSQKP
jgi:RNA polymerase-interacting CarD/CdnL/TRCF family regulator